MPTAEVSMNVAKKIRIINPVENGSNITSLKRALQFVKTGRAVFVGSALLSYGSSILTRATRQRRGVQPVGMKRLIG
jgi:type III secretory pathway component EscU